MIDLLDFIKGNGTTYDLEYSWAGGGRQRIQTQTEGRRFFNVKGSTEWINQPAEWEELWYTKNYIWRGTDTSPGNGEIYQTYTYRENGTKFYGTKWLKRLMVPGEIIYLSPEIHFKKKSNGMPIADKPPYVWKHSIQFVQYHSDYSFHSGITLPHIVELNGYTNNTLFEKWYFAHGLGLVGWQNTTVENTRSYIVNVLDHEWNMQREELNWFSFPELPEDETTMEMRYLSSVGYSTNIRSLPSLSGNIVGRITKRNYVGVSLDDKTKDSSGYWWYQVHKNNTWGWVRNDVVVDSETGEPLVAIDNYIPGIWDQQALYQDGETGYFYGKRYESPVGWYVYIERIFYESANPYPIPDIYKGESGWVFQFPNTGYAGLQQPTKIEAGIYVIEFETELSSSNHVFAGIRFELEDGLVIDHNTQGQPTFSVIDNGRNQALFKLPGDVKTITLVVDNRFEDNIATIKGFNIRKAADSDIEGNKIYELPRHHKSIRLIVNTNKLKQGDWVSDVIKILEEHKVIVVGR